MESKTIGIRPKNLIDATIAAGFDIIYKKEKLVCGCDAFVDYKEGKIVVGNKKSNDISLMHECFHVLYDEVLDEPLSEKNIEKSAKKIVKYSK